MIYKVTTKETFGCVGNVRKGTTAIFVNGIKMARVAESNRVAGRYFADFTRNNGKSYFWAWSAGFYKAVEIRKASTEAVKLFQDLEKEKLQLAAIRPTGK